MKVSPISMRDVPVEELPEELVNLRMVVECILGMCWYPEKKTNLRVALSVIVLAREDLDVAEKKILAELEGHA